MPQQPKRILVFGMTDNPGGVEALLLNVMAQFDPRKLQFDFIANTKEVAYEERLLERGSRIFRVKARRESRLQFYRDLDRVFREHSDEFVAIWENTNSLANISYLAYAKRYGIPNRIMHCHNSQNSEGFVRGMLHRINRARVRAVATHFWSVSDDASEWFFGRGFRNLPNYKVVDNAIDVARFAFDQGERVRIRGELGIPERAIVVGNVGRLHSQKNQAFLLDVVAEMEKRVGPLHVILVGKGDLEHDLRVHATSLGISDRIHFVGAVSDAKPYYDAMDLFLFPSLYEGLSIALLEAQANCLPCVVSTGVYAGSLINSNTAAISLGASVVEWSEAAVKGLRDGRIPSTELAGTKHDIANFSNIFEGII